MLKFEEVLTILFTKPKFMQSVNNGWLAKISQTGPRTVHCEYFKGGKKGLDLNNYMAACIFVPLKCEIVPSKPVYKVIRGKLECVYKPVISQIATACEITVNRETIKPVISQIACETIKPVTCIQAHTDLLVPKRAKVISPKKATVITKVMQKTESITMAIKTEEAGPIYTVSMMENRLSEKASGEGVEGIDYRLVKKTRPATEEELAERELHKSLNGGHVKTHTNYYEKVPIAKNITFIPAVIKEKSIKQFMETTEKVEKLWLMPGKMQMANCPYKPQNIEYGEFDPIENTAKNALTLIGSKNKSFPVAFGEMQLGSLARRWCMAQPSDVFANHTDKAYHEVINTSCNFFVDIDKAIFENNKERIDYINGLGNNFERLFKYYYDETPFVVEYANDLEFTMVISKSSKTESYHIIFQVTLNGKRIVCPSASFQRRFWSFYKKAFEDKYIDLEVYRVNAQLRYAGIKAGEDSYLYRENKLVSIELKLAELGLARIFKTVPEDFIVTSFGSELRRPSFELSRKKVKYYSEYEQLQMLNYMDHSQLREMKREIWISAVSNIFHFFHTLAYPKRVQLVLDFCRARGYTAEKYDQENKDICLYWHNEKRNYHYDLEDMKTFFKPAIFESEKINMPEVIYPDDFRVLCVRSGTNTKKTTNFINKFRDAKVFYISYRCSLAREIIDNAEFQGIKIAHYKDEIDLSNPPQHLVCQLESVYKFENIIGHYDYVFCDESEALIGQLEHFHNTNAKCFNILQRMMTRIMLEKKVVFVSANLSDETLNFIKYYGITDIKYIENTKLDKEGWTAHIYKSASVFEDKLLKLASEGKKLCIAMNSKKTAYDICDSLNPKFNEEYINELESRLEKQLTVYGKVLLLSANTLPVSPSEWDQYDHVIYTPSIEAGVNFVKPDHFDHICGYFISTSSSYAACYQQLFRCRNPKSKEMHIYVERGQFLESQDYFSERSAQIEMKLKFQDQFKKSVYDPTAEKYSDPLSKAMTMHKLLLQHSRYSFGLLFQKELRKCGIHTMSVEGSLPVIERDSRKYFQFIVSNLTRDVQSVSDIKSALKELEIDYDDIHLFEKSKLFLVLDRLVTYYKIQNKVIIHSNTEALIYEFKKRFNNKPICSSSFRSWVGERWDRFGIRTCNKETFLKKKDGYMHMTFNSFLRRGFYEIREGRLLRCDAELIELIETVKKNHTKRLSGFNGFSRFNIKKIKANNLESANDIKELEKLAGITEQEYDDPY